MIAPILAQSIGLGNGEMTGSAGIFLERAMTIPGRTMA